MAKDKYHCNESKATEWQEVLNAPAEAEGQYPYPTSADNTTVQGE